MQLAEKIMALRKQAGWSQEELAARLGVTRQSVSKWEGAQSVPELEKLVQISELFQVSTDFLLKGDAEQNSPTCEDEQMQLRHVDLKDAQRYLELRRQNAPKMALGVFLCVISPIALILLAGLSGLERRILSESVAVEIGLCGLLLLAAAAVALFLRCAAAEKRFALLQEEALFADAAAKELAKQRQTAFQPQYDRQILIGTVLCILSVLPLFASVCFQADDIWYVAAVCLLLLMVAVACLFFVSAGYYEAAMEQLLEQGEYTREKKKASRKIAAISGAYWLLVTAVFFFVTFGPRGNGQPQSSWIVWAIGGVVYAALRLILRK